MKSFLPLLAAACLFIYACDSSKGLSVTANPDPTTATSGTAASAKFTDGPNHPHTDTLTQKTDTTRIKRDNPPR